jgi:RNA polymerase sigma factor (TIGR02999 family)
MRQERPGHVLQTTALVNEAYLRLMRVGALERSPDSRYFFAAAARAMRCILVDHARNRHAEARAGMKNRVALDYVLDQMARDRLPILELNEAMEELERLHTRQAKVVDLRYFAGCTIKEASAYLGVSEWTVEEDFRVARAWLRAKLDNAF